MDRKVVQAEIASVSAGIGDLIAPYIGEIDPDPRNPGSRYRQGGEDRLRTHALYREVLRDDQVYSTLNQRLDAAVAVPWEVEPGGRTARDRAAADHLRMQLERIGFDRISKQMMHAVWYGFSAGEMMWRQHGSRIEIADIRVRAVDRFDWNAQNQPLLRTWQMPDGGPLPDRKFWIMTRAGESGDSPHGPGLAYWCYWPVWFRRNGHRFWAIAMERFGSPVPVGKFPPGDEQSRQALLDVLASLAAGSGAAIPEGQNIELLHAMRSMGDHFASFPEYFDRMISKVILGQSSTTEQGPWRGTAEVQKDVRDEVIRADCRMLSEAFTNGPAAWLTAWNFPGAAVPQVFRNAEPPEDLDRRAQREETVARTTGLQPTLKHVQEVYGGDWEAAPDPPAPGTDPEQDPEAELAGPGEDAIDAAIGELLAADGWEPYMRPSVGAILKAAREAGDLETLRARVDGGGLFADFDTSMLAEVLGNLMFSARASGQG